MTRNGTRIVKFFLHLSREEQRKRFLARIDEPREELEIQPGRHRGARVTGTHYMKAYEKCLSATSTEFAPWYVVPADDKANARLIVARIVLDTLAEPEDELSGHQCRTAPRTEGYPPTAYALSAPAPAPAQPVTAATSSGSSFFGEFTRVLTGHATSSSAG